jgi:hypothetical protein
MVKGNMATHLIERRSKPSPAKKALHENGPFS